MTVAGRPLRNPQNLRRIPPAASRSRSLGDAISASWALAGGLSWLVLFSLAVAIEPAPANPQALPSALELLFVNLLVLALSGTALGLGLRRRSGFGGSLAASGVLLLATVACPVTGHHALGGWWFGQLACVAGLVAMSLIGLRFAPSTAQ